MIAFMGPVVAELGWEVMTIQAQFRYAAKSYHKVIVCSFPESEFLYADFADCFIPHSERIRALKWYDDGVIKSVRYKWPFDYPQADCVYVKPERHYNNKKREYISYGVNESIMTYDYLIHARNIFKGGIKNYNEWQWEIVTNGLSGSIASIGQAPDWYIHGTDDLRGIDMDILTRYMAGARCVIGGSSGVMHLATLCKAPIVTWGDQRTYFNKTLDIRYKEDWNPFHTPVEFIFTDLEWKPDPMEVVAAVSRIEKEIAGGWQFRNAESDKNQTQGDRGEGTTGNSQSDNQAAEGDG